VDSECRRWCAKQAWHITHSPAASAVHDGGGGGREGGGCLKGGKRLGGGRRVGGCTSGGDGRGGGGRGRGGPRGGTRGGGEGLAAPILLLRQLQAPCLYLIASTVGGLCTAALNELHFTLENTQQLLAAGASR
jgi:hypothetical protein